jgi:hypothetical protein
MARRWFFLIPLLLFLALACNIGGSDTQSQSTDEQSVEHAVQTLEARMTNESSDQNIQTLEAQLTQLSGGEAGGPTSSEPTTGISQASETPTPSFTSTIEPSSTLTPTITNTSTSEVPMVSVSVDTNCRTGPGQQFDYVGALFAGETAEVVGKEEFGNYWIIKNPDRPGECWLWSQYATVNGNTSGLPVMTPPPTPTPTFTPTPMFDWNGTWTIWIGPGPFIEDSATFTQTGNILTGSFTIVAPITYSISGTLNSDWQVFNGVWDDGTFNGVVYMIMDTNLNQFRGNFDGIDAFCGARNGNYPKHFGRRF